MAKLDFPAFEKHLAAFDFVRLFIDVLGWNRASSEAAWSQDAAGETIFSRRTVAELGGVVAIQVVTDAGWPDEQQRMRVWKHIASSHAENLLIFTDKQTGASQSQWYWVKRDKNPETGKPRLTSRRHEYFKGQPVDLFASKLQAMVVELSELDASGRLPVLEAARRIAAALDVEKTTKKFFKAYQDQHLALLEHIQGIDNERDKRWYASVLLNRLMFVWFLQKKGFLHDQKGKQAFDYLREQLQQSEQRGANCFYREFLAALFFEAFAKPEADRSKEAIALTGRIPYLNGGLFLPHKLELDADHALRLGKTLHVADEAFKGIFDLFASFTWHLDDTPGGDADEINPDVLGYIFEKYINQKAFGAYYTRPEITSYLADRSIHKLILERVYEPAIPELHIKEVKFDTVPDLLAGMDARTALKLVNDVLPSITILDPAVGSGAFLVAALKSLINVYYAVVGRAELGASKELEKWLKAIQKDHPSVGYYIKRRIVTDNLHGVDIMEEACEIAKLRLFLAMVASVRQVEDLEPLPNIDFNILPGNSLVGLMRVDEVEFNHKEDDLFKPPYRKLVEEKNRLLKLYRDTAMDIGPDFNLREVRDKIDTEMQYANGVMNELLRDQFEALGVKFEEAQWDAKKKDLGKPKKRQVTVADIAAQIPFHWGYVFDDIVQKRGGFDIILANPPWEVFKPQAKEFFAEYSGVVTKNKMTIKEFEKEQSKLLQNAEVRAAWLAYENRFPHMSSWFRTAPEFKHQIAIVGGKKTGSDSNLYKLFVERSFHLLRPGGHCGIVIPSGIYTDLGAKGLRDLLFEQTQIEGLFCFENRKTIFEGVDSRFKFVVLTYEKAAAVRLQAAGERNASAPPDDLLAEQAVEAQGGTTGTTRFPAAFMRHDVEELTRFPDEGALWLEVEFIKRLSPDSHSVMEFKSALDVQIANRCSAFPFLCGDLRGWNLGVYGEELHMNRGASYFVGTDNGFSLYEGGMIGHFDAGFAKPRFWVNEGALRADFLEKRRKRIEGLVETPGDLRNDYEEYRIGIRKIARNTDTRTLISTIIPKNSICGNSLAVSFPFLHNKKRYSELAISHQGLCVLVAMLNSFVVDWLLRGTMTSNLNTFYLFQLPVAKPDLTKVGTKALSHRAARLICTTPEFDDLAKSVGLKGHQDGATDPTERAKLRAELDGLVAHIYGLSEEEFTHILGTFPLVADAVKVDAHNAYRRVAKGLVE
ncbi:MAG: ATP-binding protein [Comamonadaceae bacterium PBBC2]|nr:MAG: ATP-binding protein [Comamonadaceae bacterium PBBC2]